MTTTSHMIGRARLQLAQASPEHATQKMCNVSLTSNLLEREDVLYNCSNAYKSNTTVNHLTDCNKLTRNKPLRTSAKPWPRSSYKPLLRQWLGSRQNKSLNLTSDLYNALCNRPLSRSAVSVKKNKLRPLSRSRTDSTRPIFRSRTSCFRCRCF